MNKRELKFLVLFLFCNILLLPIIKSLIKNIDAYINKNVIIIHFMKTPINKECKTKNKLIFLSMLGNTSKMFLEQQKLKSQDVKFTTFEKNVVKKHLQNI